MITFLTEEKLDILCLGAHCDDIEIGCGATLLKWKRMNRINRIIWVVFSSNSIRKGEAQKSAEFYLEGIKDQRILILEYRDAFLPFYAAEIKEHFEGLRKLINPSLIFTHYRDDRHQDHRLLSDLAWNTFRDHLILEYEIPKYDGDLGVTNAFVPVEQEEVELKIRLLLECYSSQVGKHWFDEETFKSLLRLRGMECNSPSRYAESYYLRKCCL